MGVFGFLGDVASAAVKTALTPLAVAKDAVSVTFGEEATATKDLFESVGDDLEDAGDEIMP
jgi:hypothetical protein